MGSTEQNVLIFSYAVFNYLFISIFILLIISVWGSEDN